MIKKEDLKLINKDISSLKIDFNNLKNVKEKTYYLTKLSMVITIALLAYSPSFIDTILQSGIFLESYYLFVKIGLFFIIASMLLTILYKVYKKEKIEINEIINNNRKVKKSINDKIKEIESKQYGVVLSLEESKKNYKQFIELIGYNYSYTYINEGKLEYPIIKNLIKVYNKLKFKKNLSYEEIKNYIEFYTSIDSNFQYYKLESKESDKEIETILIEGKRTFKNKIENFFNNYKKEEKRRKSKKIVIKEL
tara:strand:+ start:2038 stop:2790 length:753 start_codon:yes stop_codon:yes gene_type:complete